MDEDQLGVTEAFLAGRVEIGAEDRPVIPPEVSGLVELALASPDVAKEIPSLNDDWIKVAGFRRGWLDVAADGKAIVPPVVEELVRLGLRLSSPVQDEPLPPGERRRGPDRRQTVDLVRFERGEPERRKGPAGEDRRRKGDG